MAVREDGIELFGFSSEEELKSFRSLTNVSGIGPKAAMSILSTLTPQKLALAVASQDKKAISAANGMGAKTAEGVILGLKHRRSFIPDSDSGSALGEPVRVTVSEKGAVSEAAAALAALGYGKAEIAAALKDADPSMSVDLIIKQALKKLF